MALTSAYPELREKINNGDIILFRGIGIRAWLTQYFDKSYYNHAGVVFISNERYFSLDSNADKIDPLFLSHKMKKYTHFCIVRPVGWYQFEINDAVRKIMHKDEKVNLHKKDKASSAQFIRRYLNKLNPPATCYENSNTPWDFIIYADEKFKIIGDDSDKAKYRKLE